MGYGNKGFCKYCKHEIDLNDISTSFKIHTNIPLGKNIFKELFNEEFIKEKSPDGSIPSQVKARMIDNFFEELESNSFHLKCFYSFANGFLNTPDYYFLLTDLKDTPIGIYENEIKIIFIAKENPGKYKIQMVKKEGVLKDEN